MGYSIDIQFIGICCFAVGPTGTEWYKRRVLLPYDAKGYHIPFVEIAVDDVDTMAGDLKPKEPAYEHKYCRPVEKKPGAPPDQCACDSTGCSVFYYRWTLDRHFVQFANADSDAGFATSSSYVRHIPQMKNNVEYRLHNHPCDDCFDDGNPPNIVSAIVNIPSGTLSVVDFEEASMSFKTDQGDYSPYEPARPAKYVHLNLPLKESQARIIIKGFPGQAKGANIRLKQGATARIGNAMEADITGPGSGMTDPSHFKLFYQLDYEPPHPALPTINRIPLNACSPTDWP